MVLIVREKAHPIQRNAKRGRLQSVHLLVEETMICSESRKGNERRAIRRRKFAYPIMYRTVFGFMGLVLHGLFLMYIHQKEEDAGCCINHYMIGGLLST